MLVFGSALVCPCRDAGLWRLHIPLAVCHGSPVPARLISPVSLQHCGHGRRPLGGSGCALTSRRPVVPSQCLHRRLFSALRRVSLLKGLTISFCLFCVSFSQNDCSLLCAHFFVFHLCMPIFLTLLVVDNTVLN